MVVLSAKPQRIVRGVVTELELWLTNESDELFVSIRGEIRPKSPLICLSSRHFSIDYLEAGQTATHKIKVKIAKKIDNASVQLKLTYDSSADEPACQRLEATVDVIEQSSWQSDCRIELRQETALIAGDWEIVHGYIVNEGDRLARDITVHIVGIGLDERIEPTPVEYLLPNGKPKPIKFNIKALETGNSVPITFLIDVGNENNRVVSQPSYLRVIALESSNIAITNINGDNNIDGDNNHVA